MMFERILGKNRSSAEKSNKEMSSSGIDPDKTVKIEKPSELDSGFDDKIIPMETIEGIPGVLSSSLENENILMITTKNGTLHRLDVEMSPEGPIIKYVSGLKELEGKEGLLAAKVINLGKSIEFGSVSIGPIKNIGMMRPKSGDYKVPWKK